MTIIGQEIQLDGDELATAVDAYLAAHNICVSGSRTITYSTVFSQRYGLGRGAKVYVDPRGRIYDNRDQQ